MIVHIVELGETIHSIAEKYGVSAERLMVENEIRSPDHLAIGETLVILFPEITHIVNEGDTLGTIAAAYGVDVMQLLRNNPYLSDREFIFPGEMLVIKYTDEKSTRASFDGYVYPFIDLKVLRKTLPFLTYMTVFTYSFNAEGELDDLQDEEIIRIAKEYGVPPFMMISPFEGDGITKTDTSHMFLSNDAAIERMLNSAIQIAKRKGYYGINIDTVYILWEDRDKFTQISERAALLIRSEGLEVFQNFSPSPFEIFTGIIYESLDFTRLGRVLDAATLVTYDWGYDVDFPSGTLTLEQLKDYLEYANERIPSQKILTGLSVIGYNWKMPYIAGVSRGQSVSYRDVIELAHELGETILYDKNTLISYYQYVVNEENIVRFRDARYFDTITDLIPQYGARGAAIWNIMRYFAQMWLVINAKFEINKII